jgi:BNR repeat-like domain
MDLLMRCIFLLFMAVFVTAGEHNHPVGVTDGVASLDVCADGKAIHELTAVAKPMSPIEIHYRRSDDSGSTWNTATIITTGMAPHKPNRTADIQIAAHGDQLLAAWSVAGTGFMGSGPLMTAISHDGGRSWSAGANPADDNSMGGHSFVDLAVDGSGRFHAAWLDNRSGKQGLIYSNSDDGGHSWATNRILDPTTCECCWNTLFANGDQVHVLFRASSPRDMRLFSSPDRGATFSPATTVGMFNWTIEACLHVGGDLTSNGNALHAVVWTGADNKTGVYHLRSQDRGATWSEPHPFPIPRARQTSVAVFQERVIVCTTANDGSGNAIWIQRSDDNGSTWQLPHCISVIGKEVAHPKTITTTNGIHIFWTERTENGAWTVASWVN